MDENPGKLKPGNGVMLLKDAPEAVVAEPRWRPLAGSVMTVPKRSPRMPRFQPGDQVRVRYGATVPDFEDIRMGGWTGTIRTVEQWDDQIVYEIEWDRRTLDAMHPVYKKRCERDNLAVETLWLAEEDVEPDDGIPVPIEPSTEIKTPPLSEKDQNDRVRKALGLTHDDPIPEISLETLRAYHRYLSANLRFPFTAYAGEEEVGPFSRKRATITVTGLLDPDQRGGLSVEHGLFCTVRDQNEEVKFPLCVIKAKKKDPNARLTADYAYWFHNWPVRDVGDSEQEEFDEDEEQKVPPLSVWLVLRAVLFIGVGGGIAGAAIGAALRAIAGAKLAAVIGGLPLALIGGWILGRYGYIVGAVNRLRFGLLLGALLGLVAGGLAGVIAGLMMIALPWSLVGLLAGMFLGPYVLPRRQGRLISFRVASLGACGGILVSAFRQDRARATAGAAPGAITGLIAGAGFVVLLAVAAYLIPGVPRGDDDADGFEDRDGDDPDDGRNPVVN